MRPSYGQILRPLQYVHTPPSKRESGMCRAEALDSGPRAELRVPGAEHFTPIKLLRFLSRSTWTSKVPNMIAFKPFSLDNVQAIIVGTLEVQGIPHELFWGLVEKAGFSHQCRPIGKSQEQFPKASWTRGLRQETHVVGLCHLPQSDSVLILSYKHRCRCTPES